MPVAAFGVADWLNSRSGGVCMRREIYGDGLRPEPVWNSVGRTVPVLRTARTGRASFLIPMGRNGMVQPTGRVSGL